LLQNLNQAGTLPVLTLQDGPPSYDGALYQASQIYTTIGEHKGAEYLLRTLITDQPDHSMALNNLGYTLLTAGNDHPQTIKFIERAHDLLPEDISVLDTFAWLRYHQGRLLDEPREDGLVTPGALSLMIRAIHESEGPVPELLDHLGDVLWRLGDRGEAARSWQEALALLDDPEFHRNAIQNFELLQSRVWNLVGSPSRAATRPSHQQSKN